jgi:hypothetical protein
MGVSALLALSLAGGATAHRLDEYLQATLIGVTRDGIDVEIHLTPGVAMLPVLMAVIDQDSDGRISSEEERAYVGRVAREVELRVDGVRAPLSLIDSNFPTLEAMREGLGTIGMKLRTARPPHPSALHVTGTGLDRRPPRFGPLNPSTRHTSRRALSATPSNRRTGPIDPARTVAAR